MKKSEKARKAFLQVLRQRQFEGRPGIHGFDLVKEAREISVPPSRLHNFGNTMLRLAGRDEKPYRPDYSFQLYPTLRKLGEQGLIGSELESEPPAPDGLRRRLYYLTEHPE